MKKLLYSPDAIEKMHKIKQDISIRYGAKKAKAVIQEMTKSFRDLQQFKDKGSSVEIVWHATTMQEPKIIGRNKFCS